MSPSLLRRCAPMFLLATLTACTAERAHTVPFDGKDNKGIVYSVPKTYLSITMQYTYTRDDLRPGPAQGHLAGALRISPLLVPDPQSTFLIKTDSLVNNVLFLSSVNFRFNNGTLESVDATSVDRTGQIIEELGTVAVNIAKAAAKGEATPHERAILATERRIDEIYAAIAKVATDGGEPQQVARALDALQQELNSARRIIMDLRNNIDPPIRTFSAPLTVMLDPDAPTRTTADYLEYEIRPPQLFPDVPPDNMDVVCIRIYDDRRREFIDALHAGNRPTDTGGILYRQPVPLLTKVVAGDPDDEMNEIFSGLIPYVQFAPPAVAAIDSKVFTSKRTSLVLDTINGGLISYGIAQDSPAENAAKAAVGLSDAAIQIENPKAQGTGKVTQSASGASTRGATTRSSTTQTSTDSGNTTRPASQPSTTRTSGRGGTGGAP